MIKALEANAAARLAGTLCISAAGGLVAHAIGLPAAWIAGGLLAVALASLAGVPTDVPRPVREPVYLILGIYAGSGVTPETFRQMQTWPASFAILAVSVVALIASSYWWLHGRCGWDRNTALLSSLPGALSFVLAAAENVPADQKKIAITQSLRLLILIELVPLFALLVGHSTTGSAEAPQSALGLRDALIVLPASIGAALLLGLMRLPGAWMLGGMVASAGLLLGGVAETALPPFVVVPCTIALGAIAGSRFEPGDRRLLPGILGPALGAFAIACAVSLLSAVSVTLLFGLNIIQTVVAFAPGALDALVVLAFQMNIDPAYVAAHHVARFLALVAAAPILARWLNSRP